jgi:hypothetical protein
MILLAVISFAARQAQKPEYAPDDTYIYMQYADNISHNNGFSFNKGEPSFGVTSPLWAMALSIGGYLKLDFFWFAKYLDLLFIALAAFYFYKLSFKIFNSDKTFSAVAVSVFLMNLWIVRWSFIGMETSLAVFLLLFTFYTFYYRSFTQAFLPLGFLFLVRPETCLLTLLFFIYIIKLDYDGKKINLLRYLIYIVLFFLPIVPFWIFAYSNFGAILPNTVFGKSTLTFNLQIFYNQIKQIFITLAPSDIISIIFYLVGFYFIYKLKILKMYALYFLWPLLLIGLYVITDADIMSRYLVMISPVIMLIGVKGFELSVFAFKKHTKKLIVAFYIIIFLQGMLGFYYIVKPHTDNFTTGTSSCFKYIGRWFNDSTNANSKILVNDVGAVGFYSKRYIIDAAALVNRDLQLNKKIMSTPVEERSNTANLLKFIDADYVITRDTTTDNNLTLIGNKKLDFLFYREFQGGLGISDTSSKFYKVYKVNK